MPKPTIARLVMASRALVSSWNRPSMISFSICRKRRNCFCLRFYIGIGSTAVFEVLGTLLTQLALDKIGEARSLRCVLFTKCPGMLREAEVKLSQGETKGWK